MSIKYLAWAMDTEESTKTARLVLFVLAESAQDHQFEEDGPVWAGVCWPSVDRIAKKARCSRRAAFDALAELVKLGMIRNVEIDETLQVWNGRPITTTLRQVRGGAEFAPLPVQETAQGGCSPAHPNQVPQPSEGEANASPSKAKGLSAVYGEPATPGSAAAPYLVLELARLMRVNDDKVRLPVGLRQAVVTWGDVDQRTPQKALNTLATDSWPESLKAWLDAGRLLIDSDGREPREVVKVLRWTQDDPFWKDNIHSMTKLREKYDQLRGRALAESAAARPADRQVKDTKAQLDNLTRRRPDQEDQ